MKYYLGYANNKYEEQPILDTGGTGNVLISYAACKSPVNAVRSLSLFDSYSKIVDSGAFSVWNSGRAMDRSEILSYYKYINEHIKNVYFINLDVIPGERGRKPTKNEAEKACADGLKNYYYFKKNGINTMPVFHEGDNFDYLEIFKKETDYIAISPANDSSRQRRIKWLDRVYLNLKAEYKTHGLAATAVPLLERYPFYSVDSINWKTAVLYGHGHTHTNEQTSALSRGAKDGNHSLILREEIKHFVQIQKDITNLWKKRGVKWQ